MLEISGKRTRVAISGLKSSTGSWHFASSRPFPGVEHGVSAKEDGAGWGASTPYLGLNVTIEAWVSPEKGFHVHGIRSSNIHRTSCLLVWTRGNATTRF